MNPIFPWISPLCRGLLLCLLLSTGCTDGGGAVYLPPNTARPVVLSTTPANNAGEVSVDTTISVTFSEKMLTRTVRSGFVVVASGSGERVIGVVESTGTVATLTPNAPLKPSSTYEATITADVEDVSGDSFVRNFTWGFTTVALLDSMAPTVISVSPADGAIGMAVNTILIATFSEAMDTATLNDTTFTLSKGGVFVSGSVTTSGAAATFTPAANLDPSTIYVATITTGVKDNAGNRLASNFSSGFTTENPFKPLPKPEVCDGVDNDIDGQVDEGFLNTDSDGIADCVDPDDDNDSVSDRIEIAAGSNPLNGLSIPEVCDGVDNDLDGSKDEGFPDTDADGIADCADSDDDNDGISDTVEVAAGSNPLNALSNPEVCDGVDNDLDGFSDEGFPDTDSDGIVDCADPDDDNDSLSDDVEIAAGSNPLNAFSKPEVCDGVDNDLDALQDEGFLNTDADGIANCVDPDDDNDGVTDTIEITAGSNPLNALSKPEVCDGVDNDLDRFSDEGFPDTDSDGMADCVDPDDDNDDISDVDEIADGIEFCDGVDNDLDGSKDEGFLDTDFDGVADCVDTDDDNDGVSDVIEIAAGSDPLNRLSLPEVCDGVDNDLDGSKDEGFSDTDADGIADCVDPDDDNDSVSDAIEIAAGSNPLNALSKPEVCDGVDNDLDGFSDEGFLNTDADGVADCVDMDDDNDGITDVIEIAAGSNPLNALSKPEVCDGVDNDLNEGIDEGFLNTDQDGAANCVDTDDDGDGFSDADETAAGSNPLNPFSKPEVCDGVDNDLDGLKDEGFSDTDSDEIADCMDTPDAPVLSLSFGPKQLQFSWGDVGGETFYKFMENPDGVSGFTQVGLDMSANTTFINLSIAVHKFNFSGARYLISACNTVGCSDSDTISATQGLLKTIGYFKASNAGAFDLFGSSLALSEDGSTLAVGAEGESGISSGINGIQTKDPLAFPDAGAVYIFTRPAGGIWSQQAYIKASNAAAVNQFGASVSLSADGNTLAVGAGGESGFTSGINGSQTQDPLAFFEAGAVYIFTRTGGEWHQQAYIKASNTGAGDFFGDAVSLSTDGSILAVGASGESSAAKGINGNQIDDCASSGIPVNCAPSAGAVYLFTRSGTLWSQQSYLKGTNTDDYDAFGGSASLSGDGNTLAVGADGESSAATGVNGDQVYDCVFTGVNCAPGSGSIYIFTRVGATWRQHSYLKASNTEHDDAFGGSASLSRDGNTLVVGAQGEDSNATGINGSQGNSPVGTNSGAAYLFTRVGDAWSQQAYLKASNTGLEDTFGGSVSLSSNGNDLVVGTFGDPPLFPNGEDSNATGINGIQGNSPSGTNSGAVYFFTRTGITWRQKAYVKASNTGVNDAFGLPVCLSGDGNTLAAGASLEDSNATGIGGDQTNNTTFSSGAVYLY